MAWWSHSTVEIRFVLLSHFHESVIVSASCSSRSRINSKMYLDLLTGTFIIKSYSIFHGHIEDQLDRPIGIDKDGCQCSEACVKFGPLLLKHNSSLEKTKEWMVFLIYSKFTNAYNVWYTKPKIWLLAWLLYYYIYQWELSHTFEVTRKSLDSWKSLRVCSVGVKWNRNVNGTGNYVILRIYIAFFPDSIKQDIIYPC